VLERELGVEPCAAAHRAHLEATRIQGPPEATALRVGALQAELAEIASRHHAVLTELADLAELAAAGAAPAFAAAEG